MNYSSEIEEAGLVALAIGVRKSLTELSSEQLSAFNTTIENAESEAFSILNAHAPNMEDDSLRDITIVSIVLYLLSRKNTNISSPEQRDTRYNHMMFMLSSVEKHQRSNTASSASVAEIRYTELKTTLI